MAVNNQWHIIVNKTETNKKCTFAKIEMNALNTALKELSDSAFKLYIYIAKNRNDYPFDLSKKHFMQMTGLKQTAYINAKRQLIDKGYLVEVEGVKDHYIFYDMPKK